METTNEVARADKDEVVREDGFMNAVTGVGTSKDKRIYNTANWLNRTLEFYEQLYASDELASRLVDVIPETAMRNWIEFTTEDAEVIKAVEEKCKNLKLQQSILDAWRWARNFGGSILYLVSKTGIPQEPLQEGEEIIGARAISAYDLRILSSDIESDFASENYSRPNYYHLNLQMGSRFHGYPIHWTRCIRFDGDPVPRRTYIRNNYWHDSILNRLYNPIRNYQSANDNAATILQDFNMGVYKMKNLAALIGAGKEEVVKNRLELLEFSKSSINALILDSEDEDYVDHARNVTGLAEMLKQQANRLVAATDIPHTILLGESPDGSNATGNSTTQSWYTYVKAEQENYLRPKLDKIFDIVFNDVDNEFDYKFKSLYELNEQEEADLRSKQAQTDQIYLQNQVVDPDEIAQSRFGGAKYSAETVLDKEAREAGALTPGADELLTELENDLAEANQETTDAEEDPHTPDPSLLKVPAQFPKQEATISISQSEPIRQPDVERIPPGKTVVSKMDMIDKPKAVTIECVMDGKMLMGKRKDNGLWTQPGGMINEGEAPLDAACRELFEETGVRVSPEDMDLIQQKEIKTRRKTMDIFHYRVDMTPPVATTPMNDPDKECDSWDFMDAAGCMKIKDRLHAKKNIIFDYYGMLDNYEMLDVRVDGGESVFFSRDLDYVKDQLQKLDGGPGSGRKGSGGPKDEPTGGPSAQIANASKAIDTAMAREKKAAEALENFDKTKASWWDSPEYKAAAKEHRSAVRQ